MVAQTKALGAPAAFVWQEAARVSPTGASAWCIRWFNGAGVELAMCGHLTLAAVAALQRTQVLPPTATAVGFDGEKAAAEGVLLPAPSTSVEIRLPWDAPTLLDLAAPGFASSDTGRGLAALPQALGLADMTLDMLLASGDVRAIGVTPKNDLVVHVRPALFRSMTPDAAPTCDGPMASLPHRIVSITTEGVLLDPAAGATHPLATASDPRAIAIASRCFSPRTGTPEDPACAAAHCGLTAYWITAVPSIATSGFASDGFFPAFQGSPAGADLLCGTGRSAEGTPVVRLRGVVAPELQLS
jgi:predicted PhzF superfamily epimerase YddE/YHI9